MATTIRIEDELKVRVPAAAHIAGRTTPIFILDAIAVTVEQVGDLPKGQRPGKPSARDPHPYTIVPTVDSAAGHIVADPPMGLLE